MSNCACAFCTSLPSTQFPVRVLFHDAAGGRAFWAWWVQPQPLRLCISLRGAARYFAAVEALAEAAFCDLFGLPEAPPHVVLVRTGAGVVPMGECQNLVATRAASSRVTLPLTPICLGPEVMPPRVKKKKRAPAAPAPRPRDSSDDEESAYEARDLYRGDDREAREAINRVLFARPSWDQEAVEELLRWGATPRLKCVTAVYDGVFKKACCVFVQPSGRTVPDVWLPLGVLKRLYPPQTGHLTL